MDMNQPARYDRPFTLRSLAAESFIARRLTGMNDAKRCELCHREIAFLTQHHLIPRTTHKRKKQRDGFTQEELNQVIEICAPCHKNIHAVLTEKELAEDFNTIEKLLSFPAIAKFTAWVRKQADAPIRVRRSNDKAIRKRIE
jgi:hypothetical protein